MISRILSKMGAIQQDSRTMERIREHYRIEKALADRHRHSNREERRRLYTALYDELLREVPDHPQLTRKLSPTAQRRHVSSQMNVLKPFLTAETCFLEIGPGDCALSFEVAERVRRVVAIDVSEEITKSDVRPSNFELVISDGASVDVPPNSIDVAYSAGVMEHLHPDDSEVQLRNIYRALAPGGIYICTTPHRFSGPHDISRSFDEVATGFHLKEWTYAELRSVFGTVGFSKIDALIGYGRVYLKIPLWPLMLLENLLDWLPKSLQGAIRHSLLLQLVLGTKVIATR